MYNYQETKRANSNSFSGIKLKHIPFNDNDKRKSSPLGRPKLQLDVSNGGFSFGKGLETEFSNTPQSRDPCKHKANSSRLLYVDDSTHTNNRGSQVSAKDHLTVRESKDTFFPDK